MGEIWAWGLNNYGQLGIGNSNVHHTPVRVGNKTNWVSISAGGYGDDYDIGNHYGHALALNNLGEIWAWGYNAYGQLGDGTTITKNLPVQIGSHEKWVSVSAGHYHSMAINDKGEIWSWGLNNFGQLGIGNYFNQTLPNKVGNKSNWISISASGTHVLALNSLGELWAWGYNNWGQLGDGTNITRTTPVKIGKESNWRRVSAGGCWYKDQNWAVPVLFSFSFAINSNGELWGWGSNFSGELGDSTNSQKNSPTLIDSHENWVSISTGGFFSCAINTKGKLFTWGDNGSGQLGLGDDVIRNKPTQVYNLILENSVSSPTNGDGYSVSTPSSNFVSHGDSYTFTILPNQGFTNPLIVLNSKNGVLSYSGVNKHGETMIKILNVTGKIFSNDFTVTVSKI